MAYQVIENTVVVTKSDWLEAGLTENQLKKDSKLGYVKLFRRSVRGNTMIDVGSIQRPDRIAAIEKHLGKIDDRLDVLEAQNREQSAQIASLTTTIAQIANAIKLGNFANVPSMEPQKPSLFPPVEIDIEARAWFLSHPPKTGWKNTDTIVKYVNRCSILNAIHEGLQIHREARAKHGKKPNMGEFWELAKYFYLEKSVEYPCDVIANTRSIERVFKGYFNDEKRNYDFIMSGKIGNTNTRVVTGDMAKLFVALWNKYDKPFIEQVHCDYLEFLDGGKEFFDQKTGEIFDPKNFKPVSEGTVWNTLKKIPHIAATLQKRDGYFNYNNNFSPKQERKAGQYSLSKVTMDDVCLSRKSHKGDVYKYVATDVVSGYMFRPAYIVGKPTADTVTETVRNMFVELSNYGLPAPYEADTEHHLIKDLAWFPLLFAHVTMNDSATAKRQEHFNRQLKYTVSKRNGHISLRFYGKGAYAGKRIKEKGDFKEPLYDAQVLIADDLADIAEWNNELHPNQQAYPGKTRKQVFLENANPDLKPIDPYVLWKCIGEHTKTSIVKNKRIRANNQVFWLKSYESLELLKPNNYEVEAYYMRDNNGNAETIYLYQGDTYIGEAYDVEKHRYNECRAEWTDEDRANYEFQNKEVKKFHTFVKEIQAELPDVREMSKETSAFINQAAEETEIVPEPAQEPEEPDYIDYNYIEQLAKASI